MRIVGGNQVRQSGSVKNYKRAVVGLVEPFHYPDDVEELRAKGEEAGVGDKWSKGREDWLNEKFQKDRMDENMKRARFKMYKGYRWRSRWHDNEVSCLLYSKCATLMTRETPFVISRKRGTKGNQRSYKRSRGSGQEERRKSQCSASLITASHDHAFSTLHMV